MSKAFRLAVVLALALLVPLSMAVPPAAARHHASGNFFQRHRTASSLGAGYAAYHMAKTTGRNRQNAGRGRNFAQRHPWMTAAAVTVGTHHMLRHHHYSNR